MMVRWIISHGSVFGDIALVWMVPVILVVALARILRHDYRGSEGYAPAVARPIGKNEAVGAERSRPAA